MNGATGGLPVVGHGHGEGLAGVLLQAQPAPFDPSFLFMMGSVFLIFYLLVFRPESKRRKEQEAQIKAATKGDEITTSGGMTLLAKLSDRTLTMAAVDGGKLRMIRTVETALSSAGDEYHALQDLTSDLYPTLVFIADSLGAPAQHITMAGFGDLLEPALRELPRELGCEMEPLRSPYGPIGPREAGIWGYLSQGGRS